MEQILIHEKLKALFELCRSRYFHRKGIGKHQKVGVTHDQHVTPGLLRKRKKDPVGITAAGWTFFRRALNHLGIRQKSPRTSSISLRKSPPKAPANSRQTA